MFVLFCALLAAAGVAAVVAVRSAPPESTRDGARRRGRGRADVRGVAWLSAVALGLASVASLAVSATTVVGSREVGIVTAFGKYQSTEGPGWHLTVPWAEVETFSTRIQSLDLERAPVTLKGEVLTDQTGKQVKVPGATADINVTVRWSIDKDASSEQAKRLWEKYRTFEDVERRLVRSEVGTTLREVFGSYTAADAKAGESIRALNEAIKKGLAGQLEDDGVVVDSVSVTTVDLDDSTEARLRQVQAATADVSRAQVDEQKAAAEARANAARQRSLTPEALVQRCLEIVARAVERDVQLPATFDCGLRPPGGRSTVITGR